LRWRTIIDNALTQRNGAWIVAHKCGNGGDDGGVDPLHPIGGMLHVKNQSVLEYHTDFNVRQIGSKVISFSLLVINTIIDT
jgi:hypothetical protein